MTTDFWKILKWNLLWCDSQPNTQIVKKKNTINHNEPTFHKLERANFITSDIVHWCSSWCAPNYIASFFSQFGWCSHNVGFIVAQTPHQISRRSITVLAERHVSRQPAWSEELKRTATQQLCVIVPELAISVYIIWLHQSRRGKQLGNETAGSCLSATASVSFFRHVYLLFHNRQCAASGRRKPLWLKHVLYSL